MILIVGASGHLGGAVARRLLAAGQPVRAMSRAEDRLGPLRALGAESVVGDLTDPASLRRACTGATQVLAAAHALFGRGRYAMERVDGEGNRHLIDAAAEAGVSHFVLTSACHGPDEPVDFFRVKYQSEQYLRASGLPFTILRPGPFMEVHAEMIGRPLVQRGWTMLLGRGRTPASYVSVEDVAEIAARVLQEPPVNDIVWIAGPEPLSPHDVIAAYARVSGRRERVLHLPVPLLRAARASLGRLSPVVRRVLDAALYAEAGAPPMPMEETRRRYPIQQTTIEEFVRRRHGATAGGAR